jgi:hypothetical protein
MHGLKHFWHIMMMIHAFTLLPASLVFVVYSFGAMILLSQWQLFLWSVLALFCAVVLFTLLAIVSE